MPPALPNGVDELAWAAHRSQNVQKDKKANLDHLLWGKSVAFSNQAQLVNIQCKSIEMSPLLRFLVAFIATFLQETPASNFVDLMWAWKKKVWAKTTFSLYLLLQYACFTKINGKRGSLGYCDPASSGCGGSSGTGTSSSVSSSGNSGTVTCDNSNLAVSCEIYIFISK